MHKYNVGTEKYETKTSVVTRKRGNQVNKKST